MSSSQQRLWVYGVSLRSWLDVRLPHFHVCSGRRAGGAFLQSEAWSVREMVLGHVERTIQSEIT